MTTRSKNSIEVPARSKNYAADIHNLKGKIKLVEEKLPNFSKFESYKVKTYEESNFQDKIRGLNKEKIQVLKCKNELSALHGKLTSVYYELLDDFKNAEADSQLTEQLNKLEKEKNITGMINTLESIESSLDSLLIEIDLTIDCETILETPVDPIKSHVSEPETTIKKFSGIKLTSVEVPTFDGASETFAEFIASFDQLVHMNEDLSEIEKGIRLKQSLTGRAAMCIKGIPITTENYANMYERFRRKFEKASVNKHVIVEKLENLPESGRSADECMDKLAEIDAILNQLDSAKMSIRDSNNLLFHRLILTKFPQSIVERVVEKTKEDDFTVEKLMTELENVVFSRNFSEKAMIKTRCNYQQEYQPYIRSHQQYTHFPITANKIMNHYLPNQRRISQESSCVFCPNADHQTENCRLPIQEKKNFLNEYKLCWKCYRGNHASFQCVLPNCSCGGLHNPSICRYSSQQQTRSSFHANNSPHQNPAMQNNDQPTNRNSPSFGVHLATIEPDRGHVDNEHHTQQFLQTHHVIVNKETDLPSSPVLMTSNGCVFSPSVNQFVEASLLFDSGSNCTLVSEKFAKEMRLKILSDKEYFLNGINERVERIKGWEVEIMLKDLYGNHVVVNALTTPKISDGIRSVTLNEKELNYVAERKIDITNANFKGETICPDILIGADFYNQLVINQAANKLPSGLHVVSTVIGSAIFGVRKIREEIREDGKGKCKTYTNIECALDIMVEKPCKETHQHSKRLNTYQGDKRTSSKLKAKRVNVPTLSNEMLLLLKQRSSRLKNRKCRKIRAHLKLRRSVKTFPRKTRTGFPNDIIRFDPLISGSNRKSILKKSLNLLKVKRTLHVDERSPLVVEQVKQKVSLLNNANRNNGELIQ